MNMDFETFKVIITSVVSLVSVLLTALVIPWLKNKLGAEKLAKIEEYTTLAVRCAEQIYTPEQWAEKKKYVMQYIVGVSEQIGLEMSMEDLNVLIEGIVNEVKKG